LSKKLWTKLEFSQRYKHSLKGHDASALMCVYTFIYLYIYKLLFEIMPPAVNNSQLYYMVISTNIF